MDHHVHGALKDDVSQSVFETLITESDRAIPAWMSQFDSQVGFAIRRWCAPVLGLPRHAAAAEYMKARASLGTDEVNRRLLSGAGVGHFLVETGYRGDEILNPEQMGQSAGQRASEVVRLEAVAESIVESGVTAKSFPERYVQALANATTHAVGVKSIIAYRWGFDFEPARPAKVAVIEAARNWLEAFANGGPLKVEDPVLLRFFLWAGVDRGLPIQLHTGYGDPDLRLDRCNPLLLTPWIKLIEPASVDIMLLHCYPYHREAGYLAQVFPHVYFDVGLGVNYTGVQSEQILAESLELTPFSKLLFSSDAWGPAELHYLGSALWRQGMTNVLQRWVDAGDWSEDDAIRVVNMIATENATRVYKLAGGRS
ncbi:amidohydrolase family protein [Paenarthrobacter sp. NPDC090520]|uniref:amidohydrolase family protein n=1 Tax=Paenarthrobacter sp. NPDC090520 TaxID=3364382 RepID=UPI00382A7433